MIKRTRASPFTKIDLLIPQIEVFNFDDFQGKYRNFSSLVSWTGSHSLVEELGACRKGEKGKGGIKMGGSLIFGSHNKQLAPFSLFEVGRMGRWGLREERRGDRAARAMLFYGSCHMVEGAARPWLRTLTFNNRASTGPPGLFSPERRAPRGAIRAWIGAWQPCAALQGIHKRWHIDSLCLCAASLRKRLEVEGWDSSPLMCSWQKLQY